MGNKHNEIHCFIDDQEHTMLNDNRVHGLHIPPYYVTYKAEDVISRLLKSNFMNKILDKNYFIHFSRT